jgi:hypothetical protein
VKDINETDMLMVAKNNHINEKIAISIINEIKDVLKNRNV